MSAIVDHDITKLFLAQEFRLKIKREVHSTTIKVLKQLIKDKEILRLIDKGYAEFISLATDLREAKRERVKVQYYTGTPFMKEKFRKKSKEFVKTVVKPYIKKMQKLLGEKK